jgi:thiosulfate sulfurtransferase
MANLTVAELALWRRASFHHTLIDVRRLEKRQSEGDQIAGGEWHNPADWLDWKNRYQDQQVPVVVYCAYGHEISQGLSAALCAMGADARHLVGGIEAWRSAGEPTEALPS